VIDLKGRDHRLAERVLDELRPYLRDGAAATICARSWPLLEPFRGVDGVRAVHSVGSAKQLQRLRRDAAGRRLDGISIHERLLDGRTVRELRELADVIMTWPVNTHVRARELLACGVDGLISDRPGLLLAVTGDTDAA
jgi:glycerophosphoryl diester phosphodiesterase